MKDYTVRVSTSLLTGISPENAQAPDEILLLFHFFLGSKVIFFFGGEAENIEIRTEEMKMGGGGARRPPSPMTMAPSFGGPRRRTDRRDD